MKIVAVDVDLTVVDTLTEWKNWYKNQTGHDIGDITSDNNDLEKMMHMHNDPLSFWRLPNLYDNLDPIPEAKKALDSLKEDVEIIFVSHCFPEHESSKRNFLRKHFPYMKAFISTSEKEYVRCDFAVDDCRKYCDVFHKVGVKIYQIKTSLNSPSEKYPYMTWEEIAKDIKEKINL